jgi:MFS family permease
LCGGRDPKHVGSRWVGEAGKCRRPVGNEPVRGIDNITRAFGSRDYRIYAIGNAISLIGTWLQRIAFGWLAWQLTRSPTWLGVISFADLFPSVLLSPWAGALADRKDRLRVVWLSQMTAMSQAFLLAILTSLDAIDAWGLLALALLLGCANAINQPARLALIPSLVARGDLAAAVAINSVIFNLARFIGPAIAGIVIAAGSLSIAFALNALSYLAFQIALFQLRHVTDDFMPAKQNLWRSMIEGYLYAARHQGINALILILAVGTLGTRGMVELLPGLADKLFGQGAAGLASMTAAMGLGAVAGGLWMLRRVSVDGLTAVVFGNTIYTAVALLAFAMTTNFTVGLFSLAVAGSSFTVSGIGSQTLLQTAAIPAMRGRIMALHGMIFRGGPAISAVAMGAASEYLGLRWPIAAGALACIVYWIWARLGQATAARELETIPESAE